MSAWKEYKKKLGDTRPWDALRKSNYVNDPKTADERYAICLACPSLMKTTKQCKECGCFMQLKVKIQNATCPLGKW